MKTNKFKVTVTAVGYETTELIVEATSKQYAGSLFTLEALRAWAKHNDIAQDSSSYGLAFVRVSKV